MYDVLIVGGGFTGVAAACAAAREGLSVLLIEKSGYLGGAACNNFVNPFMNFHIKIDGTDRLISDGLFREIVERLRQKEGIVSEEWGGCSFNEEILKVVLDEMTADYVVGVLFHTLITAVEATDGRVTQLVGHNKSGRQTFPARYYIDATGDGDVAAAAGCAFQLGRETDGYCQPMTLCFRIGNVDPHIGQADWDIAQAVFIRRKAEGTNSNPRENILHFRHASPDVVHFNTTRIVKLDPTNGKDFSQAETLARRQMMELFTMLKEEVPAFRDSVLLASAPAIGVRESRKILGAYVLTGDDIRNKVHFDDGIAACNYMMDIHSPTGTGTSYYHLKEGEYYTIPYRCLVPKGMKNLLVAGRCISSTHEAQSSYRIMPVCCTLGEAAGAAVALAAQNNGGTDHVNTQALREKLIAHGAFIG